MEAHRYLRRMKGFNFERAFVLCLLGMKHESCRGFYYGDSLEMR